MTQITVDSNTAAKFLNAGQYVEVVDECGRFLGEFRRAELTREELIESCPLTDEDLETRRNESGGRSLSEIMDDLEQVS